MSKQIEFNRVEKYYGSFHALRTIDLSIDKGAFVALVGPSGCGKSTLLRSLAGLETISSGDILIEGQVVTEAPPRKRDIAMVFQSYALYPHMTVEENLTYSLRVHGVPKAERKTAAREVATTTGLSDLLHRYPRELSGGQRQRVAMSRAIIRKPKAFLFDEPLSNLDAALRVHMRKEIRALHDRLGATSVYVTHDQIEAMTMADRVVVMRAGVIEQQGRPLDLYDRPANKFVAGFIGSPAMNFIPATTGEGGVALLRLGADTVSLPLPSAIEPGREILVGIRPEHAVITAPEDGRIRARVAFTESTGSTTFVSTATEPELMIVENGRRSAATNEEIGLAFPDSAIHVFDAKTEQRL
jgi:multiple sugar transport system ATP-binding protein